MPNPYTDAYIAQLRKNEQRAAEKKRKTEFESLLERMRRGSSDIESRLAASQSELERAMAEARGMYMPGAIRSPAPQEQGGGSGESGGGSGLTDLIQSFLSQGAGLGGGAMAGNLGGLPLVGAKEGLWQMVPGGQGVAGGGAGAGAGAAGGGGFLGGLAAAAPFINAGAAIGGAAIPLTGLAKWIGGKDVIHAEDLSPGQPGPKPDTYWAQSGKVEGSDIPSWQYVGPQEFFDFYGRWPEGYEPPKNP